MSDFTHEQTLDFHLRKAQARASPTAALPRRRRLRDPLALPPVLPVGEHVRWIFPHLKEGLTFSANELKAIGMAFNDVCKALKLNRNSEVRDAIAERMIELARNGERSSTKLRDSMLAWINDGTKL